VIVFGSAGRLAWGMGWAVLGLLVLNSAILSLLIAPDLLAERSRMQKGTKRWDVPLSLTVGRIGPLATRYFAATVRIQTDRGQAVVTSCPYQLMRHPGYVGAIVANVCSALALGSLWALLPAAFTTVVTVWRADYHPGGGL
jgi:protein-S-isoprenylcysteine O-methyltransferase Ste14